MVVLGFGFFLLHNSVQTEVTELAPSARASSFSLHAFSFFMGQALGPMVYGLTLPFIGATASCVFGAAVCLGRGRRGRQQAAQATPARWGLTGVCTAASDEVRSLPNHGSIWAAFGVSFVGRGWRAFLRLGSTGPSIPRPGSEYWTCPATSWGCE